MTYECLKPALITTSSATILEVVNLMTDTGLQLENSPQVLYLVHIELQWCLSDGRERVKEAPNGRKVLGIWGTTNPLTLMQLHLKVSQLQILASAKQIHIKIHTEWIAAVLIADSTLGVPHGLTRDMLYQFAIHFRSSFSTCCICGDKSIRSKIQDSRE